MTKKEEKAKVPPHQQKQHETDRTAIETLYDLKSQIFSKRKRRMKPIKTRKALIPREKRRL